MGWTEVRGRGVDKNGVASAAEASAYPWRALAARLSVKLDGAADGSSEAE